MKICIWCKKDEKNETFNKKAHTFPQSLGGKSICENVCDTCNHYFGAKQSNSPAIEIVLKEILNLSKYLLFYLTNENPKIRFKSEFFKFNRSDNSINLKLRYSFRSDRQEEFGRLFRRGMYKVFLEERERQKGDAINNEFDFIRDFARYDKYDYPIYFIKPKFGMISFNIFDINEPKIRFTKSSDKLENEFKVFEYPIMGHYFCFPTIEDFKRYNLTNYKDYLVKQDAPIGSELVTINFIEHLDFRFEYMEK